jgi:hypothetical protein
LERIARDSESDHWAVMEVLTAFVREQAPAQTIPPDQTSGEGDTKESVHERELHADIQAILTVIGRRTRTFGNGETERLDLRNTNLQGAHLGGAQLQKADLREAQLQKARLWKARLQGADLRGAQLQGAHLSRAQLQEAYLSKARLQGADLRGAQLQKADLGEAQLQKAYLLEAQLQGTDLTAVANLTQDQLNTACIDENTKLPEGLTRPAPCPTNP